MVCVLARRLVACTNVFHLCSGEFASRVPFARSVRAVQHAVGLVLRGSDPRKVLEPVVARVAVEVRALHPIRCGTDERLENDPMHSLSAAPPRPRQHDLPVSLTRVGDCELVAAWPVDLPVLAHRVRRKRPNGPYRRCRGRNRVRR